MLSDFVIGASIGQGPPQFEMEMGSEARIRRIRRDVARHEVGVARDEAQERDRRRHALDRELVEGGREAGEGAIGLEIVAIARES